MARKTATTGDIVKLKITLQDISPPVWRRLLIPASMSLNHLHDVIQTVMSWDDEHLHAFDIPAGRSLRRGPDTEVENESRITLAELRNLGVKRFIYTYDFGDDWEHLLVIEGIVPRVEDQHYPACIAGERACPMEDCGGPYGYARMLEIRADPTHADHGEISEWLGPGFDPEAFSVEAVDRSLAARFGRTTGARRSAAGRLAAAPLRPQPSDGQQ